MDGRDEEFDHFERLLRNSSLGRPGARRLSERSSPTDVERVRRAGAAGVGPETILRAFDDTVTGAGGCFVLSAPAGAGKSRLLLATAVLAAERGIPVAARQAFPHDLSAPLATLAHALLTCDPPSDGFTRLARPQLPAGGPAARIHQVREALEQHAGHLPLLIVIDDAHWMDELSARAIRELVPQLASLPVRWVLAGDQAHVETTGSRTLRWLIDHGATPVDVAGPGDQSTGASRPAPGPLAGASGTGPTVLRILLGGQLRRLREAKAITREDAGWEIRASGSKISRLELGRVGFKERDVADLLSLYGVTDPDEREALFALARQSGNPGWWQQYTDPVPGWFQSYLGLEAAASLIRTHENQFVPGLLQTPEYAKAVFVLGHPGVTSAQIDRRVGLRRQRQLLLDRSDAPQLWAVIDEAVLRRPTGGIDVMKGQIEALIKAAGKPNVRLQISPLQAGGHAAVGGPFAILRFPEPELPDVVYAEQLTSALYLDKREDVDQYAMALERLCIEAEPPSHTPAILDKLLDEVGRAY